MGTFVDSLRNSFSRTVFHCRELRLYYVTIARRRVEHHFMVTFFKERTMAKRKTTQKDTVNPKSDSAAVNALKCQFLTDKGCVTETTRAVGCHRLGAEKYS